MQKRAPGGRQKEIEQSAAIALPLAGGIPRAFRLGRIYGGRQLPIVCKCTVLGRSEAPSSPPGLACGAPLPRIKQAPRQGCTTLGRSEAQAQPYTKRISPAVTAHSPPSPALEVR